ncbi:MAG: hypothetical protein LBU11_00315 [Zoogloeaceae bacterium]|jgi:hypothetical protein|nr:hypothetical protein [Zoogloeaceae bacterium]
MAFTIEKWEIIYYKPEDICGFYSYFYKRICEHAFIKKTKGIIDDWVSYEKVAKQKFRSLGWTGNGDIGLIWVPPFAFNELLKNEESFTKSHQCDIFGEHGKRAINWSCGFVVWYVEQSDEGAFILSPNEINIPCDSMLPHSKFMDNSSVKNSILNYEPEAMNGFYCYVL